MNSIKTILSDRFIVIVIALSILVSITALVIFISAGGIERKNNGLKEQLKEMEMLKEELVQIKDIVESKEKKIGLVKISGVVPAMEQTLNSLGIEAKVIKPLEKKTIKEFIEEDAEVQVENIDLNRIVNLLYTIENSVFPLKIKGAAIKSAFDKPDKFSLGLTVSFISK